MPPKEEPFEFKDEREPNVSLFSHFKILRILGLNLILLFFGVLGAVGYGVIPILCNVFIGELIDSLPNAKSIDEGKLVVSQVCIKLGILSACSAVAFLLQDFFLQISHARIGTSLRRAYMHALTKQEMGFFDIKKIGAITSILSEDIGKIQDVYTTDLSIFCQDLSQFVIGFVISMTVNWSMSLILVSTIPLTFISHMIMSTISTIITKKINKMSENSAAVSNEIISSMKTIRSMSGELRELNRFQQDLDKINRQGVFKGSVHGPFLAFTAGLTWATVTLGFLYGGTTIAEGKSTMGSVFQVYAMLFISVIAFIRAARFLPLYGKAYLSETAILKVVLREPAIPFSGGLQPEHLEGNISLRSIDFAYPSRPNVTVMKDFSLEILKGQTVALVGPSGSGKSTIVGLLERFYSPLAGEIFIDGNDISKLDPMWLHRNLGYVSQEPILFSGSIKYNIAYACGLENCTMEQIEHSAKQANAHNFIMDLPDKYDTVLGEKGVSLSGGQKQRIAIARALLQDPKVLLLDEATSALDSESEALVQNALEVLMKGRTTICIAHRLTTIINSDIICVLVKGVLEEKGNHSELIKIPNGIYKSLIEKQMVFSEDNKNQLSID